MSTLRDELRKAAALNRKRPEWTKRRMPTIVAPTEKCRPEATL